MDAGGEDGDRKKRKRETPHINDEETSDVVILLVEEEEQLRLYASGKGGIAKYEKFFQFIYEEPITVASLDFHGIIDMLEIASELSCEAIVNACDHYLACVYWPQGDRIGARLVSICDKFKCSQELAQRLVEYGHLGSLKQKAVEVWDRYPYSTEGFVRFTLRILPIVPEEFVAHKILPRLAEHAYYNSWYNKMLFTIVERSLSNESDASNHLVIAKGLVRCLRRVTRFEGVEDKLNQLVSKLGEVEQWDVFVEWAEGGKRDWPNLHPSWFNFCQHFRHLPAVRDAALKSWQESKNEQFFHVAELLMELMPEVLITLVSEELQRKAEKTAPAHLICKLCTDMLEQVTAGKLLLDTSQRVALAKQVRSLMSAVPREGAFAVTARGSLMKLVETIPAEIRWDFLLECRPYDWPSLELAFGPLQ